MMMFVTAPIAIPILVLQFTHSAIATDIAGADNITQLVSPSFMSGSLLAIAAVLGWCFMPMIDYKATDGT